MIFKAPQNPRVSIAILAVIGLAALGGVGALAATGSGDALPGANVARIVLGSVAAFALLLLTARVLPRLGGATGVESDAFRIVASLPLGQRERVVVVQVGEQQVMLGVAQGRVNLIQALDEPLQKKSRVAQSTVEPWINRILGRQA